MPIPKTPLEYVCLFPADIETVQDGTVYAYTFVDAFDQYLFSMEALPHLNDETILQQISKLMQHPNFIEHRNAQRPFTLVLHKFQHLLPAIKEIIKPLGGAVIVDEMMIIDYLMPALARMYQLMASEGTSSN
jgi:hypothetical protein